MQSARAKLAKMAGFTLIEMSIVLVIIGLIVGGVLVGQDLIRASYLRAQISQIEKFNTAVNTFYGKFQALPGDMNASTAATFGFTPRGQYAGEGDGNGIIEGINSDGANQNFGDAEKAGETVMFWVDLSSNVAGNLIEGGFNTATPNTIPIPAPAGTGVAQYLPEAKLGRGNYVYVWSCGPNNPPTSQGGGAGGCDGNNYYGVSVASFLLGSTPGMTVKEAYDVDRKIDDGMPGSGRVIAEYLNSVPYWTQGYNNTGALVLSNSSPSSITCFDTAGVWSLIPKYSVGYNNGAGLNCALSFRF